MVLGALGEKTHPPQCGEEILLSEVGAALSVARETSSSDLGATEPLGQVHADAVMGRLVARVPEVKNVLSRDGLCC